MCAGGRRRCSRRPGGELEGREPGRPFRGLMLLSRQDTAQGARGEAGAGKRRGGGGEQSPLADWMQAGERRRREDKPAVSDVRIAGGGAITETGPPTGKGVGKAYGGQIGGALCLGSSTVSATVELSKQESCPPLRKPPRGSAPWTGRGAGGRRGGDRWGKPAWPHVASDGRARVHEAPAASSVQQSDGAVVTKARVSQRSQPLGETDGRGVRRVGRGDTGRC